MELSKLNYEKFNVLLLLFYDSPHNSKFPFFVYGCNKMMEIRFLEGNLRIVVVILLIWEIRFYDMKYDNNNNS